MLKIAPCVLALTPVSNTPGDGVQITLEYYSMCIGKRTVTVGTTWDGVTVAETSTQTLEKLDRQSWRVAVTEPLGSQGMAQRQALECKPLPRLPLTGTVGAAGGADLRLRHRVGRHDGILARLGLHPQGVFPRSATAYDARILSLVMMKSGVDRESGVM